MAEHVNLSLNLTRDYKSVLVQVLVDVGAYEIHALSCQIQVGIQTVHVLLAEFHLFLYGLFQQVRHIVAVVGHLLKVINNLLHD